MLTSNYTLRLLSVIAFLLILHVGSSVSVFSQKAIFMPRHAERAEYNNADGELSSVGKLRARALATLLQDAGITKIYVSHMLRTHQTAEPLAALLRLRPVQMTEVQGEYAKKMLSNFKNDGDSSIILVIGHFNTFIPLLRAMGHEEEIKIGDREHDDIFVVFKRKKRSPIVMRLNY